eukprot:m.152956 g.152956  ORF g.152956 m.152956 type:complete len:61 (+) comp14275_c0_seq1:3065-3247(+)
MWTESLPAFNILIAAVAASGLAITGTQYLFHRGQRRYNVDKWDSVQMKRDQRLQQDQTAQ